MRLVLLPYTTINQMTMPTLMRVRGELICQLSPTDPPVQNNNATLWIGIGPANYIEGNPGNQFEDAYQNSQSNDWMWFQSVYLIHNEGSFAHYNAQTAAYRFNLDIRSKRRFDFTDDLVMVVTNVASVSLPSAAGVAVLGRCLFQETGR